METSARMYSNDNIKGTAAGNSTIPKQREKKWKVAANVCVKKKKREDPLE